MAQVSSANNLPREYPRLTPDQQKLLLDALKASDGMGKPAHRPGLLNNQLPNGVQDQSVQSSVNPSLLNTNTFGASMFPPLDTDFDVDFTGDPDFADPFSDVPAPAEEHHEKRKSPEEEDEELADEENVPHKRQENEDKTTKKPGRKPLTTEPATKRKAQNRAAQRAFRERKEKHLRDLEQKVIDLEKASESANHENGLLRAQVERLHNELREYRRRLSLGGGMTATRSPTSLNGQSTFADQSQVQSSFQFDFPKFGSLPGTVAPFFNGRLSNSNARSSSLNNNNNNNQMQNSLNSSGRSGSETLSPIANGNGPADVSFANSRQSVSPSVADSLEGLFSPSILHNVANDYGFPTTDSPPAIQTTHASSLRHSSLNPSSSNTASPSVSSLSQNGPTSSAGTSPEPMVTSPATKPKKAPSGRAMSEASKPARTPTSHLGSFDWLAHQNGGHFDPVLFGDYRESHDAIIGAGDFSGGFFDDTLAELDNQFLIGSNPPPSKKSLMEQIEEERSASNKDEELVVPGDDDQSFMTCHKIWNKLQTCPKFQAGELDIDGLCSELHTKAKCSETGVVVPREDVEAALWKLAGIDENLADQPALITQAMSQAEQIDTTDWFQGMAG